MADSTRSDAPLCAYDWCSRPVGPKRAHAPYCASCYTRRNRRKRLGHDPDVRPTEYKPSYRKSRSGRHGSIRAVWPIACLECEAPLPTGNGRLTCGQRCHDARQLKRRPTADCAQCGKPYNIRNGTKRVSRYCSYRCSAIARAPEPAPKRTPIAFVSCLQCRAEHVMRATTNRKRQPCCKNRCRCGAPSYDKGATSLCWPCFYERYKDNFDAGAGRRRARLKTNGPIENITRTALAERDGWRCHLCGKKVRTSRRKRDPLGPSIDHLIPVHLGGTHTWDNVALAHERCNLSKGVRPMGEQLLLIG